MPFILRSSFALAVATALFASPVFAQTGDNKPGDKPAASQSADAAKDSQRQVDEFAEASRMVMGPAGNPECVWLGRRVVGLLWRDDMDTAFRHLDLYDRFGCPGTHIQSAFRCVVRQGANIDPKSPQSLNARVHSCWVNPSATAQAAAAPATSQPASGSPSPAPATTPAPGGAAPAPSPAMPAPGGNGTGDKDAR